jgi:hypothetical protein
MIYVPIAEDCYSTIHLDKKKLRVEAYYFDWIIISPEVVLQLFENDFIGYMDKENLVSLGPNNSKFMHKDIIVKDTRWDIYYLHHFDDLEKDYDKVKSDFDKRIERLRGYLKQRKHIKFYFKPASAYHQHYVDQSPYRWGKDVMLEVWPKLKSLFKQRYGYTNDLHLQIYYL